MSWIIEAQGITKNYSSLSVLKGIDLKVEKGEIISIVGASGAGKTTLLQILGTLEKPDEGKLLFDGCDIHQMKERELSLFRNEHIGFVFQFHQLFPAFSAIENVMLPALIGGANERIAQEKAQELLKRMHLEGREKHKPAELSGGEKQRVAVARALINNPFVVLADEPSGSLDTQNKEELHQLFFDLRKELGQTFLIVTHDEDLAKRADRTLRIVDGKIEE